MLRAVGFTLLLLGVSAPTWALLCNFRCNSMQASPDHIRFSLEEGLPACCGNQQVMAGQVSVVKPQPQFRSVSQPQRQTGNDLHAADSVAYASLVPLERFAFLSSNSSSTVLRI